MNRKLRHLSTGFPTLAAALALSILVVLAARPTSGATPNVPLAGVAAAGAEAVAVSALSVALQPRAELPGLDASPSSRSPKATRRRQSLLMPYFSFASRD